MGHQRECRSRRTDFAGQGFQDPELSAEAWQWKVSKDWEKGGNVVGGQLAKGTWEAIRPETGRGQTVLGLV